VRLCAVVVAAVLACDASARPKIGVALGGGGARGAAHVGVLRALEEMHIPIDYVAGTSMGSVVGSLYASGMTPDQIEKTLTTTDWRDALNDRTKYKDLAYRRKEDDIRTMTALELGLRDRRPVLPGGMRSAQKLRFLLQTELMPVAAIQDFNKLPVPFRAVAADIETGDAVVLDHGDLAEAVRASMSIPGVFSPVELEGKLLVDGGVANNVPVDVVRAMGADIVIAIDVGSPLLKREQLGSLFSVTSQVLTILTRQNAAKQMAKADIVLVPPVSDFATMAFEDSAKIIEVGTRYGRSEGPRLQKLAVGAEEYAAVRAARAGRDVSNRPIDFVDIQGSRRVDHRIIQSRLKTRPGRPLDGDLLRSDVTRLYGLDDFQEVTFALRDTETQHGLEVNLKDKPWGPTYMRFGINLTDDLRGQSSYNVVASINRTRLNRLGAEWRHDLKLGRELGFTSEFYQPLDFRGRFFFAPSLSIQRSTFPLFEDERRVAVFNVVQQSAVADLGMQFEDWGELRAGIFRGRVRAGVDAGKIDLPFGSVGIGGVRSTLSIVRTDSPTIPRDGFVVLVEYYDVKQSFGATDDYSRMSMNGYFAVSRGRQTFIAGGGVGTGTNIPRYDEFALGGLLSLGAYAEGQIHGQRFGAARVGSYRLIRDLPADLGRGVYAGALIEFGSAWSSGDRAFDDLRRSITALLGADTIIGPVLFGYARGDHSQGRFYVAIGKTF
jgi:NTE family protein